MFTPVNRPSSEICHFSTEPPAPRTLLMDLLFARMAKETASRDKDQVFHEKLFYQEYLEVDGPKVIQRLYREMQEFLKAKSDQKPIEAFAMAFQISSWLFRQNPPG